MNASVSSTFSDYLADVTAAARDLPPHVQREILQSLEQYIREASAEKDIETITAARTLVEFLGDPRKLVDEAGLAKGLSRDQDTRDVRHVLLWLTIGSLIPVAGWLYGIVRLWRSHLWTTRDKLVATTLLPGGLFTAGVLSLAVFLNGLQVCVSSESGETQGLGGPRAGSPQMWEACHQLGIFSVGYGWLIIATVLLSALAGPTWLSSTAATRPSAGRS